MPVGLISDNVFKYFLSVYFPDELEFNPGHMVTLRLNFCKEHTASAINPIRLTMSINLSFSLESGQDL